MKVSIKVTKKDRGLTKIKQNLEAPAESVAVGWLGGSHGDGMTNAQLAAIHELGVPERGIPARAPVATMMRTSSNKISETIEKLSARVLDGSATKEQALGLLGTLAASELKKTIASGPHLPPPLKPATVARKKSDRPLVDTGRLVNSISWKVKREGEE
jgi:hypothetical protein